jgi:ribosomal protein S18 acetylase RimI-like enzyme
MAGPGDHRSRRFAMDGQNEMGPGFRRDDGMIFFAGLRASIAEFRMSNHFQITTDPSAIDFAVVHGYLANESYWCKGVPAATLRKAIDHSLCFTALDDAGGQVGFARVVTDRATYAYLCDVFVVETARGAGLGKALVEAVVSHPDLQGLRRFALATRDAHALYAAYGFAPLTGPERFMEIYRPGVYAVAATSG